MENLVHLLWKWQVDGCKAATCYKHVMAWHAFVVTASGYVDIGLEHAQCIHADWLKTQSLCLSEIVRGMVCRRSSQLATSVVHQFKQNAAIAHASRLSEPSGMPPSYHSSSDSLPDSPNSAASAPQLGQDGSEQDSEAGKSTMLCLMHYSITCRQ